MIVLRHLCMTLALFINISAVHALYGQVTAQTLRDFAINNIGDASTGKAVFENAQKSQCANCHRITGKEKSGPNLDGIGDKYDRQKLIEHVLQPSLSIMPGYEQVSVVLKNGRAITGRFERATKVEVRIIDALGKQTNLQRDEVEEVIYSTKSLMPENLADQLTLVEFADLIAYLQTLTRGVKKGVGPGGVDIDIPHIKSPIQFHLLHAKNLKFKAPVWCGPIPGANGEYVAVEHQEAKAWRFRGDGSSTRKSLFLDLSGTLHVSPNQGLMCLAFHPEFEKNRRYFLEYEIKEDDKIKTLVVERLAREDGQRDSGKPSIRLLEVEQPAFNHNGGCIAFGCDGMLYAAFGDGGPQEDPNGYSQDGSRLKGSMVRIDVDQRSKGSPYAIPADNPFLDAASRERGVRPETFAIGFREPWRFSFDSLTGDLWVGDVGQTEFEEVAIVKAGENHGWNVREAYAPFSEEYRRPGEVYTDPIFAYPHGLGFSVTGGHVYRGKRYPDFHGVYVFGDFNTRRIWGLKFRADKLPEVFELGRAPGGVASFGEDHDGELLLVTYEGHVYRMDFSQSQFE